MKKVIALLIVVALVCSISGCGETNAEGKKIENVKEQQASITLTNGEVRNGTYTGEMVDGVMDGKGTFTAENSEGIKWTYEGQFVDGNFKGYGAVKWEDNSRKEEGEFDKELLNGEGKIYLYDVLAYEGTFKNGELNGKGVMYDEDDGTVIYEGDFDMGRPAVTPVGFNGTVSFADWEYTCTKAEKHTSIGDYSTDGKYIVYLLNIKNNSKSSRELGDYFILEDNQGRIYDMNTDASLEYHYAFNTKNWYLDGTGASMTSVDVPIVFEVPNDAEGFRLIPDAAYYKNVAAIEVKISE